LNGQHNIRTVYSPLQSLRLDGSAFSTLAARAPQWVAVLLVVALGGRAAWLVADLSGATRGAHGVTAPAGPGAPAGLSPRLDLASLIGANLFGSAAQFAQQGPAPVTSMALVLVGVMAAEDPQRGVAILGTSAPAAKVYLVGATLPGGARLHAIYSDRVLIEHGGSIEALPLPRQPSAAAPAPPPTATAADRMQQLVQQNPGVVSTVLRPQVVLVDGRQRGFRVFPGPNRQAFNKLGLRPGDLVTAINGTMLDDPTVANNVFGTLSTAPNAHVTVMRDGRQQDLVINVAQAVSEAERLGAEPSAQTPTDPTVPPP
jgi:general secretion pathway protein C